MEQMDLRNVEEKLRVASPGRNLLVINRKSKLEVVIVKMFFSETLHLDLGKYGLDSSVSFSWRLRADRAMVGVRSVECHVY